MSKHKFRIKKFEDQKGLCYYCDKPMSFNRTKNGSPARDFATFEHLIRKDQGGKFSNDNIVLAHRKCNHKANIEWQK